MFNNNKEIINLYKEFHDEKIISGIKNENLKINFLKSHLWLAPLILAVCLLMNVHALLLFELYIRVIGIIILGALVLLTIYIFLSDSNQVFFENEKLIFKNKLGKRRTIDISRYPRIYIRCREYEYSNDKLYKTEIDRKYYLYIEQDNKELSFDIKTVGCDKIKKLLNSIETKNKNECIEIEWNSSASNKERNYSSIIKYLNKQSRIIGVKNSNLITKISNNIFFQKRFIICTFIMIISFGIGSILNNRTISDFFITISAFGFVFDLFFLTQIIEKGKNNSIKIMYPSDGIIIINKYRLDYKNKSIMVKIDKIQSEKEEDKYSYSLIIQGETDIFSIPLNLKNEDKLKQFIDNLIFEEKNEEGDTNE